MRTDSDNESGESTRKNNATINFNTHEQFIKTRLNMMYQCPPNDEVAEIHRAATTFGYNPIFQKGEKITICPCCEMPINTIQLPMSISTTPVTGHDGRLQFFVLDSGASMFFTFIKMTIYYLVLLFFVSNLYPAHISYFTEEYCKIYHQQCGNSWFIHFSPVKFSKTNYAYNFDIMNILNIIMIGASIIFFVYLRKYLYDIYGMLDLHNETQDDFTILVKNIPLELTKTQQGEDVSYEQQLKNLFQAKINIFLNQIKEEGSGKYSFEHKSFIRLINQNKINPEEQHKVKSISLCFDLKELEELFEQRQKLIQQHLSKGKQKKQDGSQTVGEVSIPDRIAQINAKYLQLCKQFAQNRSTEFNKSHFIGKAFVSFQFQHYRNFIMHLYETKPQQLAINGQQLKINQATYPSDIFWLNLKIGKWTRVTKIMISYLALLVVLIVVFAVITAIEVGQQKLDIIKNSNDNNLLNRGLGYGYTVLIALIVYWVNYILVMIIKFMTDKQRHETKTKYLISLIIKMFIAQFLNTAAMYFLLSFRQGQHYLMDDGLVVQISNLMIISGFISVPLNFFQVDSKIQWLWKKFRYGFLDHDLLFQVQYNQINQLPEFDFADRYCYYLVQIFTLVFYSYINPICVPAIIIIVILHYWIDKYNLLKCSSSTFPMNFVISKAILKIFQLSLAIFALGNYFFASKLQGQFSLINFIGLMVAIGHSVVAVFSPAYIQQKIFGSDHEIQSRSYSECLQSGCFKQTYWGCNPATMFSIEPDINQKDQYIAYALIHKIGQQLDLQKLQSKAESIVFE